MIDIWISFGTKHIIKKADKVASLSEILKNEKHGLFGMAVVKDIFRFAQNIVELFKIQAS